MFTSNAPFCTGAGPCSTTVGRTSLSWMVPVPVSVAVTLNEVSDTPKPTVKVSSCSTAPSAWVATAKVWVSPAVPVKASAAVLAV